MLDEIGEKKNIPRFIEEVKAGRGRLMGFGHRVYKSYDPRAKLIKKVADEVFEQTGLNPKLEIALELERIALEDEYFIKRKLYPNVDFYSGLIYQAMGYPTEYFTVLFALGRMPGWLAQWEEMLLDKDQKIARPRQIYTGHGRAAVRPHRQAVRRMTDQLDTLLSEQRRFPTTAEFAARAAATDGAVRRGPRPGSGSGRSRRRRSSGCRPWSQVLDWKPPHAKWFVGGKLNVVGQLPRPAPARARGATRPRSSGRASRATAGCSPTGTSRARCAAAPTRSSGSASGGATGWRSTCRWSPRPPSPCSPAPGSARCTRWSSAGSPPSRCATGSTTPRPSCSSPPTAATGAARSCRSSAWPTQALAEAPSIKHCIVVRRRPGGEGDESFADDDRGPRPLVAPAAGARVGRRARPRRWTPRTCSSSSTPRAPPASPRASSTPPAAISPTWPPPRKYVFDLRRRDVFWCTADIGWVTGHSYVVYGPLANGATVLMYEGAPDWPERDRFWRTRRDATASPSSTPRPPPSAPS